jgi:bifunctional polynucleotide phosphatase/kinase
MNNTYKKYNIDTNYIIDYTKQIFGFDLDSTLIKFNLKTDNFELQYPNIINKLKDLSKLYNIIIITNQNHNKYDLFETKIKKLLKLFETHNIYISIYVSIKNDFFRKPNTNIISIIEKDYNNKIKYYCGDACGREKDFSDTDLKFAINLNIPIFTPEYIFCNDNTSKINIDNIIYPKLNIKKYNFEYNPQLKDMVIMVGFAGSGKSTIAQLVQEKGLINNIYYEIINRDTLKTIQKCINQTIKSIKLNYSIIIDNTNPSKEERKKFIDIGKKYNYNITIIEMNTTKDESIHNNYYRAYKYNKIIIPNIAYNIYKSKYQKPLLDEKINKIIKTGINIYDIDYYKYYY